MTRPVAVLVLAGVLVASVSLPPATSPAPGAGRGSSSPERARSRRVTPTRPRDERLLVLADEWGDSVIVRGDSLKDHADWWRGLIERQDAERRYRLADGTTLVVDSATAGGRYILADSAVMELEQSRNYPRGVSFSRGAPRPAFFFRIHSRRHVCAVVTPEIAGLGTRALLDSLGRIRAGKAATWPDVLRGDAPTLIQYPPDWYRSAMLEIARDHRGRLRITWVAYDDAWSANPETLATEAGMLRQRPLIRLGRSTPPVATWDDVRLKGRIIGSVVADPVTRRLEPCRGHPAPGRGGSPSGPREPPTNWFRNQ